MWGYTEPEDGRVQVFPIDDLIEHDLDDDCVCVPRETLVHCDDGSDGWVITHHSLDGRELTEAGRGNPSQPTGG